MGGRKRRRAYEAGLEGSGKRDKEALDDLKQSITLLSRSIDGVLGGLPDCYVELIEHGITMILTRGAADNMALVLSALRNKHVPFLKPGIVVETGAAGESVALSTKTDAAPSVKSAGQRAVNAARGEAPPKRGPAAPPAASPSPPPWTESWQAATEDDAPSSAGLSEAESTATTSSSASSPPPPPSPSSTAATTRSSSQGSSSTRPPAPPPPQPSSEFNVLLEWYAAGPGVIAGRTVESLPLTTLGVPRVRDRPPPDVPRFFQVWDENSDRGGGGGAAAAAGGSGGAAEAFETAAVKAARRVDLVVWHLTSHTLELPVDESFTAVNVAGALGRAFALNFAMVTLLEAVNDEQAPCGQSRRRGDGGGGGGAGDEEEEVDDPGDQDPDVVEFFARFEANLQALMEEARSAPASFSRPPPNFSGGPVKDYLRTTLASVRRRYHGQEQTQHRPAVVEKILAAAAGDAPTLPGSVANTPGSVVAHSLDDGILNNSGGDLLLPAAAAAAAAAAATAAAETASPTLVLRPMEDLFRVFSDVELMLAFEKTAGGQQWPRGRYEMWFERKTVVRAGLAFRHEYVMETGHWYGG